MKVSKEVQAQARSLVRLCKNAEGVLQEDTVRRVASAISTTKPRNYLSLLRAFTDFVRLEKAQHTATVTSAIELTPEEKSAIRAKLETRYPALEYEWNTDCSLIAGLTVKVGDDVTDSSVRSRIERLSRIS